MTTDYKTFSELGQAIAELDSDATIPMEVLN